MYSIRQMPYKGGSETAFTLWSNSFKKLRACSPKDCLVWENVRAAIILGYSAKQAGAEAGQEWVVLTGFHTNPERFVCTEKCKKAQPNSTG